MKNDVEIPTLHLVQTKVIVLWKLQIQITLASREKTHVDFLIFDIISHHTWCNKKLVSNCCECFVLIKQSYDFLSLVLWMFI